jgi:hypothetical protein
MKEEKYDFGKDLGIKASTASVLQSNIPNMRMTDPEFQEEARRLTLDQLRYLYYILHQYRWQAFL